MILCGIDYSLTSPSLVIHDGVKWNSNKCKFYYLAKKPKDQVTTSTIICSQYEDYTCDEDRYEFISNWALNIIKKETVEKTFLEGYSYGSVGRVFQIAENGGVLKHKLWKHDLKPDLFAPSEIKKFGSGKGNANKEKMWDSFIEETGINLFNILGKQEKKNWNPVSDMVDAYYICKLGHYKVYNPE